VSCEREEKVVFVLRMKRFQDDGFLFCIEEIKFFETGKKRPKRKKTPHYRPITFLKKQEVSS